MKRAGYTVVERSAYRRAVRLVEIGRAVAEVFGGERKPSLKPEALRQALWDMRDVIRATPGAHLVIIGALAVQQHGYERYTEDIDVVVDAKHFDPVRDALRARGYELTMQGYLVQPRTGMKIDFLKEGVKLKDAKTPLPHPRDLGPNVGYATLPALLRLKLDSRRLQDKADVVAVLKRHIQEIAQLTDAMPAHLREQFVTLAEEARRELEP